MKPTAPEELGFSSERLARLDAAMQGFVDRQEVAGVVTAVARWGKLAHLGCAGWQDREAGLPMRPDTIFRIYSMSKPVTSVAALMLLEEGCLRLSDPVSQYIPGFKDLKVLVDFRDPTSPLEELRGPVTVRQLFTHTAGLSYGTEPNIYLDTLYKEHLWNYLEGKPGISLEQVMNDLLRLPLAFQPGAGFRYSVAADVLGYLVQVISGIPFEVFMQNRIFDPLGMRDTSFLVPQEDLERFAACYQPGKAGGIERVTDRMVNERFWVPFHFPMGGGGLVSTAADYLRFAQMLMNGGVLDGARLLGRKTIEWMSTNHLPPGMHPFDDPGLGFGLGVGVRLDPALNNQLGSKGNYGWSGFASTTFWVDPQEELVALIMPQLFNWNNCTIQQDFTNLVYAALVD